MVTEQEKIRAFLNFRHEWEKSKLGFVNSYTRGIVTYVVSLLFLLFGVIFFVTNYSLWEKLLFLGIVILVFTLSCLINTRSIFPIKEDRYWWMLLLSNVFGFLFNAVYFVTALSRDYGFRIDLGGIEKFVLEESDGLNLIEMMYSFVFSLFYIALMTILISYGLSLKDRHVQGNNKFMVAVSYVIAISSGFSIFLFVLLLTASPKVYDFFIYITVGSMFFIYAENLFWKSSPFNVSTSSGNSVSVQ